jgi:hypothetical protein
MLDANALFELPLEMSKHFTLQSPYKDQRVQSLELEAGQPQSVTLEPFEVLVLDAMPKQKI